MSAGHEKSAMTGRAVTLCPCEGGRDVNDAVHLVVGVVEPTPQGLQIPLLARGAVVAPQGVADQVSGLNHSRSTAIEEHRNIDDVVIFPTLPARSRHSVVQYWMPGSSFWRTSWMTSPRCRGPPSW